MGTATRLSAWLPLSIPEMCGEGLVPAGDGAVFLLRIAVTVMFADGEGLAMVGGGLALLLRNDVMVMLNVVGG